MKHKTQINKLLTVAVILLALGVILGMVSANIVDAESIQELKSFVTNSIDNSEIKISQLFISGARQNLIFVLFAFLGSFNIYLFGVFMLAYILKGFSVGFTLFFTAKHFSMVVSAVVIISALLYCVVLFPIYIALFCLSYKYAANRVKNKATSIAPAKSRFAKTCLIYTVIYMITLIGCAFSAAVNPLLAKLL